MQINNDTIIEWLWWVLASFGAIMTGLVTFIISKERKRIDDLEDYVSKHSMTAITRPEVEIIVNNVKMEFKDEHKDIINALDKRYDELRSDIHNLSKIVIESIRKK